jgi:hypothetical protein
MITHWAIWRKSLNAPVLGFIGSTIMTAVGRNNSCQKIPYRDRVVLRDSRPQCATIGTIFFRNTCPMEKHHSQVDQPINRMTIRAPLTQHWAVIAKTAKWLCDTQIELSAFSSPA